MPTILKSALVPYPNDTLYRLVNEAEHYPEFLPWCRSARVLSRSDTEQCVELEVMRLGIRQVFSTCNRMSPPFRIELALRQGPFSEFQGVWNFIPLRENACRIEFRLHFEFSNLLLDKAFGAVFQQIANTLVDAFCQRAREIHGHR
ncbi:MAG: type II toxin-antitoxin system RatA family toxin [Pseudomonadota bacterium]